MKPLKYLVVYKNGEKTPVAIFQRDAQGDFMFEYMQGAPYEFPGFSLGQKKFLSEVLWEQIAFRVPNIVRDEHPDIPLEELLKYTNGQLVTDHFEFHPITEA